MCVGAGAPGMGECRRYARGVAKRAMPGGAGKAAGHGHDTTPPAGSEPDVWPWWIISCVAQKGLSVASGLVECAVYT